MTREEAINIISQMIKDEEGFLSDNTVEAHKLAIKALEQEPFINKPCISVGICEHDKNIVLDKIRAEIDEQYDRVHPYNISCAEGLEMALEIIDKYKAESEEV